MQRGIDSEPKEISVMDVLRKYKTALSIIKRKVLIIISFAALGAVTGLAYAYFKKPTYTSICTFVLDDGKEKGLGQYAGLASLAGVDLGGGSTGGGVFEGDNIIELYKSQRMIIKTLLSPVTDGSTKQLLIDRYINALHLRERWKSHDDIDSISFDSGKFSRQQDSLLIDIANTITKKVLDVSKIDKKLNVMKVEISFRDEIFSKDFNNTLVNNVNEFYSVTKTKKERSNVNLLQHQVDSVRAMLNGSIGNVATALDAAPNANPNLSILRVPSQKQQINVQASTAVYTELVKNLELAKISLRKEAPLIQVIDEPMFPLQKNSPGKILFTIIGFLAVGFVGIISVLIRYTFYEKG